jgi:hypothetical protein
MMFPLVIDLAADSIPVAVTCRVLGFSKQAFYQWRGDGTTTTGQTACSTTAWLTDPSSSSPKPHGPMIRPPAAQHQPTGHQRLGRVSVSHHRRLHPDASERLLQVREQPLEELLGLAGEFLGVVGVHHLQDRLPQRCLLGRPGQRPSGQTHNTHLPAPRRPMTSLPTVVLADSSSREPDVSAIAGPLALTPVDASDLLTRSSMAVGVAIGDTPTMTSLPPATLYHRWMGWHALSMRRAVVVTGIGLVVATTAGSDGCVQGVQD